MSLLLAILVTTFSASSDTLLEAENAELVGVEVATARAGYSGSGYVTGFDEDGDLVRFSFETGDDVYSLHLGYAQSARISQYDLIIDGEEEGGTLLATQGTFKEKKLGDYWFSAGEHVIEISGQIDVDYLRVAPADFPPPEPPPFRMSDPQATSAARSLVGFLLDIYGERILSGQQTLNDIQYVENVTGKTPAIGSFDLIEYSPSRIQHGANPGSASERWIEWAGDDGIVNLMWHWNAPTDLINEPPDRLWWSGFYTRATTFNLDSVLAHPASERYQLLLRDIDAIAVQLQKFEDAEIPVLWRPLHEAAGGWFWWGAHGPDAFIELWRLMYDRIVHEHDIHNLIWIYTHEPGAANWYPGDDYVDIVGRDVYADEPRAVMRSDWDELQELYGDRMLIALSESGTLPDPSVITEFGIWWSWFSIWSGDFIRDIDVDYLSAVYNSELVLTRDELPAWRAYPQDAEAPAPETVASLTIFPNPARGRTNISLSLREPADVRVEIFDVTGRRVDVQRLGVRPSGELEIPLDIDGASGVYAVRVTAGGKVFSRPVIILR